jgi:hypothetical protein
MMDANGRVRKAVMCAVMCAAWWPPWTTCLAAIDAVGNGLIFEAMGKSRPAPKPDDKEQSRRFIETAREIGADEETSAADNVLGRLAKQKPEPRKPPRK